MLPEKEFRILMLRAGFNSQRQLADKAGFAPQTLSALIKGKRNTKKHKLKIATVLQIKFDYLWG